MATPGKGGRPRLKDDPEVIDAVAVERAHGQSNAATARMLGISRDTVRRVKAEHPERMAEVREEIERTIAEKVVRRIGAATDARLDDASDTASRTGAQSYRALMEAVGVVGKGVNVHVGDNYTQTVVLPPMEQLPPEVRERIAAARDELGF